MSPVDGAAVPRVFVVDDHGMVRAGVRSELGDSVTVVGSCISSDAPSSTAFVVG